MQGYEISTDPGRLDIHLVHRWLSQESYWAVGRTREVMERAIANSLCVGAYDGDGAQVGFARAVTDRATFAWLADVFVLPDHGRRGLARAMVRAAIDHSEMASVRIWVLATQDAHGVYETLGFTRGGFDHWMKLPRQVPEAGTWRPPAR